jgi:large subunit ribosomal protein L24
MQTMSNAKLSIRKNDQVEVISGREKGKTGKVLRVDAKTGRVLVEKTNMVKRHVKPSQQNPQGGILEKELPLHYSNVLLFCGKCNRGVRHGHKLVEASGKAAKGAGKKMNKIRVCKRCGTTIESGGN